MWLRSIKYVRIRPLTRLWCPWIKDRLGWREFANVCVLLWLSATAVHLLRLSGSQATAELARNSGQNALGWEVGRKEVPVPRRPPLVKNILRLFSVGNESQGPFPLLENPLVPKVYHVTFLLFRLVWKHLGQVSELHWEM